MEKLDLNKLEAKEGVITIIHQELRTPKVFEESALKIKGTITAPGNFIEKRTDQDDVKRSNVRFSYRERFISLETQELFEDKGYSIIGELVINPDFKALGINENRMFSVKELTKHIRMNSFFFESKEQHKKIVEGLQNFTAKVATDIKKINDNRGNIEDVFKTTMQSNSELCFNVFMPVFIGEEAKSIKVEIACEADNSAVKFWLESPDLIEHFSKDTETIINKELERFPKEYVFIQQ